MNDDGRRRFSDFGVRAAHPAEPRLQPRNIFRLMLVTDDALLGERDPIEVCLAAVVGGVTIIQLRLKHVSDREYLTIARKLISRISVPVIINDRLDVALAAGAAGVHLGPDDLSPELARGIQKPGFMIGASVGSLSEVSRGESADYWGIGPLHASPTKLDAGPALGWEGVNAIAALANGRPTVVIGGVVPEDVPNALRFGFAGVAVISGILKAPDVAAAARSYAIS